MTKTFCLFVLNTSLFVVNAYLELFVSCRVCIVNSQHDWSWLLEILSSSLLLFTTAGEPGGISDELVSFPESPDDGCV